LRGIRGRGGMGNLVILEGLALVKPNYVGPTVETGLVVVALGIGFGIEIEHKGENAISNENADSRLRQRFRSPYN
jgi:hypothetical protein